MNRTVVAALLGVLAVAGCSTDPDSLPTYRLFDNRTDVEVTIVWERESGDQTAQATIPAGETASIDMNQFGNSRDTCGDGDLIALGPLGEELIRRSASCEPWIIRLPAVPTERITDRTWTLTALVKPGEAQTAPIARSTLVLAADGRLTVETGCRTLVGHWGTEADEVYPTDLAVTGQINDSDCAVEVAEQDEHVSKVLGRNFAVHLEGDTLRATSNSSQFRDWQLLYAADATVD